MRHRSRTNNLSRKPEHAKAMTRNLLVSLVEHERIKTTLQKAKRLQRIAEKVVTLAKRDSNAAMKKISQHIPYRRKVIIDKLVNEIAPRFTNRQGGYTRVLKTGFRRGDNAEMAIIEYLEDDVSAPKKKTEERPVVVAVEETKTAATEEQSAVETPESVVEENPDGQQADTSEQPADTQEDDTGEKEEK